MKLGLVLEGGASRAYFSAGVMDFLLEKEIMADYVVGVSAGIANGVSYVSKQYKRNLEISQKYVPDKRYMGFSHLINPKKRSYYNVDFVFNDIPNKYLPFDYETFKNSKCGIFAGVTNIKTGEAEWLSVKEDSEKWEILTASCALPLLFRPVKIKGNSYMDGGIGVAIPVDKAIEEGCDKVIVITTREREYLKVKETGIGLSCFIYRKNREFSALLKDRVKNYNLLKKKVNDLENEGKIFQIAPSDTSAWGRTDNNAEKLLKLYNDGYETAKKLYPKLLEYLEK